MRVFENATTKRNFFTGAYERLARNVAELLIALAVVIILCFGYLFYYIHTLEQDVRFANFFGLDYVISAVDTVYSYLPLIPFCTSLVLMLFMIRAYGSYVSDIAILASRSRVRYYLERIFDCCLMCIPFALITFICIHLQASLFFPSFIPIGENASFFYKTGMVDIGYSLWELALFELLTIYLRYLLTAAIFMLFLAVFQRPLFGVVLVLFMAFAKVNEKYSFFIDFAQTIGIPVPVGSGAPSFNPFYYLYAGWGIDYELFEVGNFNFYLPLIFISTLFLIGLLLIKKRDIYARTKK